VEGDQKEEVRGGDRKGIDGKKVLYHGRKRIRHAALPGSEVKKKKRKKREGRGHHGNGRNKFAGMGKERNEKRR